MDGVEESIARKYRALGELFDERGRRLWAAVEAGELGRGGLSLIARATGLSRNTIKRGLDELGGNAGVRAAPQGRIRAEGGGRKSLTEKDPQILQALKRLVEPTTRGDPQSPLCWTCRSTRQLADTQAAGSPDRPPDSLRVACSPRLQPSGQPQEPRRQQPRRSRCAVRPHQCAGRRAPTARATGHFGGY